MFVMDGEKIGDKKKVDATEETYRLLNIMEKVQISNFPGSVLMNRRNEMGGIRIERTRYRRWGGDN